MPEGTREDLTLKIHDAEKRNRLRGEQPSTMERAGERAVEAKDGLMQFAEEHPFTTLLGGFALGVALGTIFPRHPIRKTSEAGVAAAGFATTAADAVMDYLRQALEAAEEAAQSGKEKLSDAGQAVSETLHRTGASVSDTARDLAADAAKADLVARATGMTKTK